MKVKIFIRILKGVESNQFSLAWETGGLMNLSAKRPIHPCSSDVSFRRRLFRCLKWNSTPIPPAWQHIIERNIMFYGLCVCAL